ncbi:MAG TPA: 4,5-DOPA dioxygenase extradiol [Verrucomicrobiae bacterium]|nr:4,5-DOPA dioxygenase extradiol [Verrucomicrobiae bacterium]
MPSSARLPVVFFGHGNPMNALDTNPYAQAWKRLGAELPRPRAILAISAHWYVPSTLVTANQHPRTIHDFGGFPRELYDVQYPAPGDPNLAARVTELLAFYNARGDEHWGLDHGTWSVLVHAYPKADVPVVQLSIDETLEPALHFEIGTLLRPLRDEGVMIVASGNIVHNLHAFAWGRHPAEPFDWAKRFETRARELLLAREFDPLIEYESLGEDARLSAPTPDHYLPLLYAMGASDDRDRVSFPVEGIDGGSVSMLSVLFAA